MLQLFHRKAPTGGWACKARGRPRNAPACGWPLCGCDPYANRVILALAQIGEVLPDKEMDPELRQALDAVPTTPPDFGDLAHLGRGRRLHG